MVGTKQCCKSVSKRIYTQTPKKVATCCSLNQSDVPLADSLSMYNHQQNVVKLETFHTPTHCLTASVNRSTNINCIGTSGTNYFNIALCSADCLSSQSRLFTNKMSNCAHYKLSSCYQDTNPYLD